MEDITVKVESLDDEESTVVARVGTMNRQVTQTVLVKGGDMYLTESRMTDDYPLDIKIEPATELDEAPPDIPDVGRKHFSVDDDTVPEPRYQSERIPINTSGSESEYLRSGLRGSDCVQLSCKTETTSVEYVQVEPNKGGRPDTVEKSYNTIWKGDLGRHEKTHTREIPNISSQPGSRRERRKYYQSPRQKVETEYVFVTPGTSKDTDVTSYQCAHCSFQTAWPGDLERHERKHPDIKPYNCSHPKCEFGTVNKRHLELHEVIHTGEKPYKCSLCPFKTAHVSSLRKHELSHSTEKPYKCSVCPYESTHKYNLKTHERLHCSGKTKHCPMPNRGDTLCGDVMGAVMS